MNEIEKSRVVEIVQLHGEIGAYLRMTLDKAIRIGELLAEQKAGMKHGVWLPWIEEHLPFSERTARDYMRFWDRREELKSATVADLREARKLLAPLPETEEETVSPRIFTERTREYISSLPPNATERIRILAAEDRAATVEGNKLTHGKIIRELEIGRMLSALELRERLEKDLKKAMAELEQLLEEDPMSRGSKKWQQRCSEASREMNRVMFGLGWLARLEYFPELAQCRCFGEAPEKVTVPELLRFCEELSFPVGAFPEEELEKAVEQTYNEQLAEYEEHMEAIPEWLATA